MSTRSLLTGVIALCLTATAAADDGLNRWAVIASEQVQNSGLADLILVEIGKLPQIQLVERQDLDRVAGELELESLGESGGVAERLKAGRLLGADVLVLLQTYATGESSSLRVVVCDCRQGARLATLGAAFERGHLGQTAKQVVDLVQRVRVQFSKGIRLVVGVTPFVSRNLAHEYDHWQARYADLLAWSIACQPGVAVIEVAEARAIVKEQALATDASVRHVPWIVSGHFRMIPREGLESDVDLTIEIVAAASGHTLASSTRPISQVPRWLMSDVARELLKQADESFRPLDSAQQHQVLVQQAEEFSKLGDWTKSAGLREAALVLDPAGAGQRARLIQEYQLGFIRDFQRLWSRRIAGNERAALLQRATDDFVTAQDHLEFLVRKLQIGRDEALTLFRRQKWEGPGSFHHHIPPESADQPQMQRILLAEQRFVTQTFPLILELSESAQLGGIVLPRPHQFPEPWWESLLWRVGNHVRCRKYDERGLQFLTHVLTRMVPADMPDSQPLDMLLHGVTWSDTSTKDPNWREFLETLSRSKQDAARLIGRSELWALTRKQSGDPASVDQETMQSLIRQADAILADFNGATQSKLARRERLQQLRDYLQSYLDGTRIINSPPGPPTWASLGRLRFQPLRWTVSVSGDGATNAADTRPLFRNMLRCGDRLDVYWTDKTFYFMNRPGELRAQTLAGHPDWSRNGAFSHVTWDGDNIWLVVAGRGIYVLDQEGHVVTEFPSETPLPGIGTGLQLLPLAPRQMLAVGSFGEHHRAWCGILRVNDQDQPSVQLFHEATRVPDNRPAAEADADIATTFQPTWIHRLNCRDGKRLALVGRDRRPRSLAIDLDSLEVSLVSFNPRGYGANDAFVSRDGNLVQLTGGGVYRFSPLQPDSNADGRKLLPIPFAGTRMVPFDGAIYITGHVWWRIDDQTQQVERLFPERTALPKPYRDLRCGVSAHFGLIGYRQYVPPSEADPPTVFQIDIVDEGNSTSSR